MKASAFFLCNEKPVSKANSRLFRCLLFFLFLVVLSPSLFSQTDSVVVKQHSPKKAAIMSAVVPGLGQIYNKKYWKLPIIYVGAAAVTYVATFNTKYYKEFRDAYLFRVDDDPNTIDNYPGYQAEDLLTMKNYYRRNLELTYIVGFAIYALNIIDASVDAYLFDFDVDDNLTLNVSPAVFGSRGYYATGLSFKLKLRADK